MKISQSVEAYEDMIRTSNASIGANSYTIETSQGLFKKPSSTLEHRVVHVNGGKVQNRKTNKNLVRENSLRCYQFGARNLNKAFRKKRDLLKKEDRHLKSEQLKVNAVMSRLLPKSEEMEKLTQRARGIKRRRIVIRNEFSLLNRKVAVIEAYLKHPPPIWCGKHYF